MNLFCDHRETTLRYGRYVSDLRRLLVFHGLPCGSVGSFEALGAKLLESGRSRPIFQGRREAFGISKEVPSQAKRC